MNSPAALGACRHDIAKSLDRASDIAGLGADAAELVRLAEKDLERHENALNEHHRTAMTVRGFAVTIVGALIASSYASEVPLPAYLAVAAAAAFFWVDYYYARLYDAVASRAEV